MRWCCRRRGRCAAHQERRSVNSPLFSEQGHAHVHRCRNRAAGLIGEVLVCGGGGERGGQPGGRGEVSHTGAARQPRWSTTQPEEAHGHMGTHTAHVAHPSQRRSEWRGSWPGCRNTPVYQVVGERERELWGEGEAGWLAVCCARAAHVPARPPAHAPLRRHAGSAGLTHPPPTHLESQVSQHLKVRLQRGRHGRHPPRRQVPHQQQRLAAGRQRGQHRGVCGGGKGRCIVAALGVDGALRRWTGGVFRKEEWAGGSTPSTASGDVQACRVAQDSNECAPACTGGARAASPRYCRRRRRCWAATAPAAAARGCLWMGAGPAPA